MSPSTAVSLLEPVTLDERTDKSPLILLVSGGSVEAAQAVSERRAYQRLRDHELEWIRHARLSAGKGVSLVDLSAGGALLDSPVPLRPDSLLTLEIIGQGLEMSVQFRVLRCEVGAIGPAGPTYRGVQVHAAARIAGRAAGGCAGAVARNLRGTGFRTEATGRARRTRRRQPLA